MLGVAPMATKVKEGHNIREFSIFPIAPDDRLVGSEVIGYLEDGCSYLTMLPPFPPNPNSPKGYIVLLASPYPVTVDEAKELFDEWSTDKASTRNRK
jgi:hypothetical protein